MKRFLRGFLGSLCAALFVANLSTAQNSPSPRAEPLVQSAPQIPAREVSTNRDIASLQGPISAVGNFPSHPDGSSRPPTSTSNGATFVNPKPGQVVHPGETIHIDLDVDSGITPVKGVGIVSRMGLSNESREGPPYSFTLTVPNDDHGGSGRLIGFQELTFVGTVVGRSDSDFATTTVDVEEPDLPLSLFAAGNMNAMSNQLNFNTAGEDEEIAIYAKFLDTREFDVTESTYLSLSSENPAVAIVEEDGTVIAIGPGQTRIRALYSLGTQQRLFYISVTVQGSAQEIEVSPATFNFGDVPSNAVSHPLQGTITNQTHAAVQIFPLEPRGGFPVSQDTCSNISLPPSVSCTFTVTFNPIRPGPVRGRIFVSNSQTGIFGIALFGKGI